MGYARNLKFGMVVTTNNRCKEIMLNKQTKWLPWLPRDVLPPHLSDVWLIANVYLTNFAFFQTYKKSLSNKKGIHKNLLNAAKSLVLYDNPPRMIPKHLNPTCYKMNITVEQFQEKA